MQEKLTKVLFLTIVIHILIMFILNMTKPDNLYYYKKNDKIPIPFGYGKNRQVVCIHTIGILLPLFLYFILLILS